MLWQVPTTGGPPRSKQIVASTQRAFDILWRFIDVSPRYLDLERRRQARLLATLLVSLIPLVTLSIGLHTLAVPTFGPIFTVVVLTMLALVVALVLNRRGHYNTSAVLTIIATAAACYAAILLPPHELHAYAYLGVNVLLAALLFGQAGIVLSAAINVILLVVILPPLQIPAPSSSIYAPVLFIIVVAALLSMALRHRELLEKDRRRALADRERLLAKAEDVAHLGSWTWELRSNVLSWSEQMYHLYGLRSATFSGDLWQVMRDATHPDDRVKFRRFIDLSGQQHDPAVAEFRITRTDGAVRHIIAESHTLHEPEGLSRRRIGTLQDITERKRAEQALRDSEAMLAKAQQVAGLGSWSWDIVTNQVTWSQQCYRVHGVDPHTTREQPWEIIERAVHPDDKARLNASIEQTLQQRAAHPMEYRLVWPDGSIHDIFADGEIFLDAAGAPLRMVGTLQDITQRKQSEQALRRSEGQYRTIVETAQEGIWQIDADNRTMFVNQKMADMLGYSTQEMDQRNLFDFMDDAGKAIAASNVERRREGIAEQHEFKFRRKDGSDLWTQLSTNPLHDAQGNYCGSLAMVTDISERKRNDDALHLLTTGTAGYVGSEFFLALVQNLAQALDVKYAVVTECVDPAIRKLRTLGFFAHGSVQSNFEYLLAGTPCEIVMEQGGECFFPVRLQHLFPEDQGLVAMGAHSYLGVPLRDPSGQPLGHLCVLDIRPMHEMLWAVKIMTLFAARAAAELRRQRAEQQTLKLSSAVEQTADAVLITDCNGTIEYVNRAFEQISGYSSVEALGQRPSLVKSGKHDVTYYQKLWKTLLAGDVYRDVLVNRRKDGALYYEEKTITPLRDASGAITHFISTGKDITERMRSQERLRFMAHHDALTELPNRALFLDRLAQSVAYARWHRRLVAIMFLDLDRFKHINDTLGHAAGDQLLQALALRLKAALRERDTVARFGGDEFAMLLDDVASETDVALLANKVLGAMTQPYLIGGHEFHLTASIGISLYPSDGQDTGTLLRNADIAMYRAKDLGKNTYQFYSAEMSHRAFERLTLEASLRRALEQKEFVIYYQPQVNMATHELLGMEALLRWQHPELGLLAPADFLVLLEETGLIIAVGDWVLRTACAQASAWCNAGLAPIRVAVNLSGHQLRQANFFATVTQLAKSCHLPRGCLELEITENVLMQDAERALSALAHVDRACIRVAIDDFGTGYSSLSYLKRFPIDTLKIDRSFVHDITTNPQDAAIVRSVIAMARSLNLEVIAEGVEHEAQLAFLRNEQCHIIQGYFISPPLPAPEATAFLMSHRAKS